MSETLSSRPAVLEWFSRPVGLSAASPAKLASMVDGALDRADRVLFTVTPREELDVSAQWQRMADQAWCGQLRHVVACTARLSGTDRDFAGDELALALGLSPLTGRALVWEFGAIACLPGLVEAVENGRLTVRHVKAFMRVLDDVSLSLEQRQAVALIALGRYTGQTPGEWAELVRRLVVTIDPQAAARRRDDKTAQRKARFFPQADEQGAMWLQAPAAQLARVEARLAAEAARLKAAGDERSTDQLVCDVALALLADGTLGDQPAAPFEVHVVVPLSVLEDTETAAVDTDPGAEMELAEIPGWGVILPDTARELARQAGGFTQIGVDDDGRVVTVGDRVSAGKATARGVCPLPPPRDRFLHQVAGAMRRPAVKRDLSGRRYRPSRRLTRLLQSRDRTCVFPGCTRIATRTDLDHRIPWPAGMTSEQNLQCLCRHHHRAKHAIFTVKAEPDGTIVWITRGGWIFRRPPRRHRLPRRPQGD